MQPPNILPTRTRPQRGGRGGWRGRGGRGGRGRGRGGRRWRAVQPTRIFQSQPLCRYYGSARGCRNPDCNFSHENPSSIPVCKYGRMCMYGNQCRFRHKFVSSPIRIKKACKYFGSVRGCKNIHCNFSHLNPESVPLCKMGPFCKYGLRCRFRHPPKSYIMRMRDRIDRNELMYRTTGSYITVRPYQYTLDNIDRIPADIMFMTIRLISGVLSSVLYNINDKLIKRANIMYSMMASMQSNVTAEGLSRSIQILINMEYNLGFLQKEYNKSWAAALSRYSDTTKWTKPDPKALQDEELKKKRHEAVTRKQDIVYMTSGFLRSIDNKLTDNMTAQVFNLMLGLIGDFVMNSKILSQSEINNVEYRLKEYYRYHGISDGGNKGVLCKRVFKINVFIYIKL